MNYFELAESSDYP